MCLAADLPYSDPPVPHHIMSCHVMRISDLRRLLDCDHAAGGHSPHTRNVWLFPNKPTSSLCVCAPLVIEPYTPTHTHAHPRTARGRARYRHAVLQQSDHVGAHLSAVEKELWVRPPQQRLCLLWCSWWCGGLPISTQNTTHNIAHPTSRVSRLCLVSRTLVVSHVPVVMMGRRPLPFDSQAFRIIVLAKGGTI